MADMTPWALSEVWCIHNAMYNHHEIVHFELVQVWKFYNKNKGEVSFQTDILVFWILYLESAFIHDVVQPWKIVFRSSNIKPLQHIFLSSNENFQYNYPFTLLCELTLLLYLSVQKCSFKHPSKTTCLGLANRPYSHRAGVGSKSAILRLQSYSSV